MSFIYKYLPPQRSSFLFDYLLRATQPEDLNDPFECVSIPPTIEEAIILCKASHLDFQMSSEQKNKIPENRQKEILEGEIQKIRDGVSPNYLEYMISNQRKRINSQFGIISFSERWDSSIMWAHYSQSHEGFCVGFNDEHEFFHTDANSFLKGKRATVKVEYSERRLKVPITNDHPDFFANSWRLLGLKSLDWSYEKEVRTIILLSQKDQFIETEHSKSIYLFKIPKEAIGEIIVGLKTEQSLKNRLITFAKTHDIKIFETKLSQDKFNLDRNVIK